MCQPTRQCFGDGCALATSRVARGSQWKRERRKAASSRRRSQIWHSTVLRHPKVHLVRYADDFIVAGASREILENEVRPVIERFLRERGLVLSREKTKITHVREGFDFLGQNLRKFGGKLLIRPSKKNTEAFLLKVRSILKTNKSAAQANVIWQLNPVIRGWVNYHRHVTASKAFERVDWAIWESLWF